MALLAQFLTALGIVLASLTSLHAQQVARQPAPVEQADLYTVSTPGGVRWKVELAETDAARSKGLMNRPSMPAATGMLFRFDANREVQMWMKNTFIPLDMIFVAEDGKVVSVHRSAVPQSLDVISSGGPVRYVLEINAGEADAAGLRAGETLLHPWFSQGR